MLTEKQQKYTYIRPLGMEDAVAARLAGHADPGGRQLRVMVHRLRHNSRVQNEIIAVKDPVARCDICIF